MTRIDIKRLRFIIGYVLVLLLSSNSNSIVVAEDCVLGNSNCASSVQKNDTIIENNTPEMTNHTPKPLNQPTALNMLAEDHLDTVFRPTPLPVASTTNSTLPKKMNASEEPKGRALNFTVTEHSTGNVLQSNSSHNQFDDLSDVTISEEDSNEDHDILSAKILAPKDVPILKNTSLGICEKGGLTYENGEKLENGCDSICTCINGKMDCTDRCSGPFFRKGKKIDDPLCSAKEADDPCCSVLVCAGDSEAEPLEICTFENVTYSRGEKFNKSCSEICSCEVAGKIACKPRCASSDRTSDRCVEVPDPNDPCCKKVLCDVTLDDHEPEKEEEKPKIKLLSARFLNTTAIILKFDTKFEDNTTLPIIDVSEDKKSWKSYKMLPDGYLFVQSGAKYIKLENSDDILSIQNTELGPKVIESPKSDLTMCNYKGKTFKVGEEYNDDCASLCVCKNGEMKCLKLECPTYFGVDVLDPNCVEWETVPPDFKPKAPHCCADEIRCKNNGSCDYNGQLFKNWEQLPINITGCEKRCYCEMGKVECQNSCPPVTALPPPTLPCPPHQASVSHIPDDDCCMYWVCKSTVTHTEIKRNETDDKTKQSITNSTDMLYSGPFAPKLPSKVLGPLQIYENEENSDNKHKNPLNPLQKPAVNENENPFYHKTKNPMKTASVPPPDYLGPLNPNLDKIKVDGNLPSKPIKTSQKSKQSINKNVPVFVTPPPHGNLQTPNYYPNQIQEQYNPFVVNQDQSPTKSHIAIHGKGNPEDLLQFINQHPEITNYPSGSVLEIHSLPTDNKAKLPFVNHNGIPNDGRPNLMPYLIHQNSMGHVNNDLPSGVTLEQILQEIHKTANHPVLPFSPNAQFPNHDHLLVAQQSGPILPNRQNGTKQDFPLPNFPAGFPNFQQSQEEVIVHTLEAIDAHTVRLAFMIPSVIVGLHGRVEVRYTNEDNNDLNTWKLQVFAPPDDLIATPQLEFELLDLKGDTEYRIKITITLKDVRNKPTSRIYKIRTPKDIAATTLPPMIPIEPDLAITDINSTWVTVAWRKFTDYEMQFIDGVQLRFKEIDGKIYAATPLIHRAVTTYTLGNLKSNTKYEIGIFFIPFAGQLTELHAENMLHFTTANEVDTYGFNITLDISHIKSSSVEITWSGVPYPEDKYVHIYRAIYQSDSGKEDHNTFKVAKRDSPTKTVIMELKPGTRYRLWLEVYLTNGKTKTSNVQDFITKPRAAPSLGASSQQDKLSRSEHIETKGDYYGPLVVVAILAAIAILSTLVLLLILVRRHNQNKAAITPPSTRVSQSAYDNPTYKVEIQQETMGL